MGKPTEGEAEYLKALAIRQKLADANPAETKVQRDPANSYSSVGRTREAVPLLAKASSANPTDTNLTLKVAALQTWFGQDKEFAATRERILAFARDINQGKKEEARKLAIAAARKMKPLPVDEKNPLAGGAAPDDLILWLAYKEAKDLIKFVLVPATPAPPVAN